MLTAYVFSYSVSYLDGLKIVEPHVLGMIISNDNSCYRSPVDWGQFLNNNTNNNNIINLKMSICLHLLTGIHVLHMFLRI